MACAAVHAHVKSGGVIPLDVFRCTVIIIPHRIGYGFGHRDGLGRTFLAEKSVFPFLFTAITLRHLRRLRNYCIHAHRQPIPHNGASKTVDHIVNRIQLRQFLVDRHILSTGHNILP
jgi:hypothetical protein